MRVWSEDGVNGEPMGCGGLGTGSKRRSLHPEVSSREKAQCGRLRPRHLHRPEEGPRLGQAFLPLKSQGTLHLTKMQAGGHQHLQLEQQGMMAHAFL